MNNTTGETQIQELAKLTDDLKQLTGDADTSLEYLPTIVDTMRKRSNRLNEDLGKTREELDASQSSYQEYYDANLKLIEAQYLSGDSLESMISKYDKLSTEQKQVVDESIQKLHDFQQTLADIPLDKRVDINVAWQQTGVIPDFSKLDDFEVMRNGQKVTVSKRQQYLHDPDFRGYAEGGIIDSPELAWIGEGGVIPDNNSRRSHTLYTAAGEALGCSQGGTWAQCFSLT